MRALVRGRSDYRRISYSLEGEDLILAALFDHVSGWEGPTKHYLKSYNAILMNFKRSKCYLHGESG